jgi:hypothetical protein
VATRAGVLPDGQRIAFVSNRDADLEIYVMNADGSGRPVDLERRRQPLSGVVTGWHEDRLREHSPWASEVFVMNADGRTRRI